MTLDIDQETQALIDRALASGQFGSAEHVVRYALQAVLLEQDSQEDEAYNDYLRDLLAEARADKEAGRVYIIPHGSLHSEIKSRRKARQKVGKQSKD